MIVRLFVYPEGQLYKYERTEFITEYIVAGNPKVKRLTSCWPWFRPSSLFYKVLFEDN